MTDGRTADRLALGLGPGAEFDIIRRFQERWGALARGIGGDCAELAVGAGARLLVSTDVSVEGVHFRADWLSPREIGYRACAAALSDLAAAAAEPLGLVVALTLPARWREHAEAIADGVGDAALATGAPIVGGDLARGGELALAVTVFGESTAPLGRAGARPGDVLWVTGRLGGPAAAVAAWADGRTPAAADRARFVAPRPRLREARWLHRHGATAAVDISDGLAADARHLAAASGVHIWLDVDAVPRVDGVSAPEAMASGEEYELLVAAPAGLDRHAFARRFGLPLTAVGRVEGTREGGAVTARVDLPRGYDHYST